MASLCYTSSSVDLSKLLLVAKVTGLPLDCVASPPHKHHGNSSHGNTVLRTTQENSSNAKHAFKLSVYRTYIYSVFYLRQVYVQSNDAQHTPRQLKVKSSIKYYKLVAFC